MIGRPSPLSQRLDQTSHRSVLNTGSGPFHPAKLHAAFRSAPWAEIRLDIDARVSPDIIGSITDMRGFAQDGSYDAIWSSHNVEHLHAHEVLPAFREFTRVLKPDGFALITCPDLQSVAALIVEDKAGATAYISPAGPITALDMMFGHGASIAQGNAYMAHNTGFTCDRLSRIALEAGFAEARVGKGQYHDLWALLLMPGARIDAIRRLFEGTEQRMLVA